MNTAERAALFRQRASEIEQKASVARTEEMRRSWLILAEDWKKMADREELKFLVANQVKLVPEPRERPVRHFALEPEPSFELEPQLALEPRRAHESRAEPAEDIEDAIRLLARTVGR